jgi:hypothetical protein
LNVLRYVVIYQRDFRYRIANGALYTMARMLRRKSINKIKIWNIAYNPFALSEKEAFPSFQEAMACCCTSASWSPNETDMPEQRTFHVIPAACIYFSPAERAILSDRERLLHIRNTDWWESQRALHVCLLAIAVVLNGRYIISMLIVHTNTQKSCIGDSRLSILLEASSGTRSNAFDSNFAPQLLLLVLDTYIVKRNVQI